MRLVVIVREIGLVTETWLTRQLELLNSQYDLHIISILPIKGNRIGFKIKSVNANYDLIFRVKKLLINSDASKVHLKRIARNLTLLQPDVIIFHFLEFALGYADIIKGFKGKVFVYCHGYDITWDLSFHHDPGKRKFDAKYTFEAKELALNTKFIANSVNTKNHLLEIGIPENKIFVKYFGVKSNNLREIPKKFSICYVGRLVDFKGPDYVILAYEEACRKGLEGELTIAGDGPLRAHIELMVKRSEYKSCISLLGEASPEQVKEIYQKSSVFTAHNCKGELTNQEEAFGVSVIEAMSYGLPVVTGNSGGVRETVVDGKTGFLVDPFDIEAHANAFLKLYQNPDLLENMSKEAQKRIKDNFSEDIEKERFIEIFSS